MTAPAAGSSEFPDVTAVVVNGTTLAYREVGTGEPVVFVHGGLSDLRTWRTQIDEVGPAEYRAITYSRRYARPNADIEPGADDQLIPHALKVRCTSRSSSTAPDSCEQSKDI